MHRVDAVVERTEQKMKRQLWGFLSKATWCEVMREESMCYHLACLKCGRLEKGIVAGSFRPDTQPRLCEFDSRNSREIDPCLMAKSLMLQTPCRISLMGRNFKWAQKGKSHIGF